MDGWGMKVIAQSPRHGRSIVGSSMRCRSFTHARPTHDSTYGKNSSWTDRWVATHGTFVCIVRLPIRRAVLCCVQQSYPTTTGTRSSGVGDHRLRQSIRQSVVQSVSQLVIIKKRKEEGRTQQHGHGLTTTEMHALTHINRPVRVITSSRSVLHDPDEVFVVENVELFALDLDGHAAVLGDHHRVALLDAARHRRALLGDLPCPHCQHLGKV
mmetsp:Transcript_7635/g.18668  ORF Transcript_7635/g.18668 Transcript_7635/m.18668 type:complete len:212 (-) Transcript_7635:330-965(-)